MRDYDNQTKSKLQSSKISMKEPLSSADWENLIAGVGQTDGLAWVQVLPEGLKSANPLQFNTIHLVPGEKIPVSKYPITKMIMQKLKESGSNMRKPFKIDAFKFPHSIKMIEDGASDKDVM